MQHDSKERPAPERKKMMEKILQHACGNEQTDEFAADTLELWSENAGEEPEDDRGIGESDYFSTCEYTMISPEGEDCVDCQGS